MKQLSTNADRTADILRGSEGYVSGESIADTIGVSRTAVWKAIEELRENGFIVEASTKRGYRLTSEKYLSVQGIVRRLRHSLPKPKIYRSVTSTNTLAKAAAEEWAPEGLMILADAQSAGRGRVGKSFYSPEGTGLYMSIVLRPKMSASEALSITACAAVSTAEAIEEVTGRKVSIKWVNDLFVDSGKVCGILTEASFNMETGGLDYAVLGIGIDVFEPKNGFGELSAVAGSLLPYSDNSSDIRCRLAAAVADRFFDRYENLSENDFFEEYRRRLFILGREIWVMKGAASYHSTALDIDKDFRLLVRYDDGREEYLSSGEISIIPV